jgi:hypothetical protein
MGILNDNLAELDAAIRAAGVPQNYDGLRGDREDNIQVVLTDGSTQAPTSEIQVIIDAFTPPAVETSVEIVDRMSLSDLDKVALKTLLNLD